MMPGARLFYYRTSGLLSCPMGGQRAGGADYNPLRRATVLPIVPAALYSSSWIFMQHHNIWGLGFGAGPGLSGPIGPGLCRIPDMDFRESLTYPHLGE